MSIDAISLYFHWPFCASKCPYCDFNSHVSLGINEDEWINAFLKEIDCYGKYISGKKISTIFFGGGTPSLAPVRLIQKIIDKLAQDFDLAEDVEITLEANPSSVEVDNFKNLRLAGVNRISIGIQSFDEGNLRFLGRNHNKSDAIKALSYASKYFSNFSFDLMYGLPNQTIASWESEIELALGFKANHMSLYQLTIEKGTAFYSMHKKGVFKLKDEDFLADLYWATNSLMANNGFEPYEISNYAKNKAYSMHNLNYWRYGQYLGIGPGAHSRVMSGAVENQSVLAISMLYNPQNWLAASQSKEITTVQKCETLSQKQVASEVVMMGLRLADGIKINQNMCKINLLDLLDEKQLKLFEDDGFLIYNHEKIQLTSKGLIFCNKIVYELCSPLLD
jgi:putative oxygen-independent coproporphyrinogen III oxidase